MSDALAVAVEGARAWIESLDRRAVAPSAALDALRRRFSGSLPDAGMPADAVIRDLVRDAPDGMMGSPSGRFFA